MNAEQVARELGISSRTVLRHIKKGTITATHKHTQELSIAEDQVEKLRLILDSAKSRQSQDTMSRQIEILTARVTTLEEKVRTLESAQVSSHIPSQPQPQQTPYRYAPDRLDIESQQSPKNANVPRNIPIPVDIPPGSVLFADFAAVHGVNRATFWRHCTSGIQGDRVDTIERPKTGGRTGDKERILTPEQQEAAIAFWTRHNVKFTR